MTKDVVSVVVPAYNAEAFLPDAIASALGQSGVEVEVIVVDDGSTDGTHGVAQTVAKADPRVRVLQQANRGAASARNLALKVATGRFVCFLDADDVLSPDALGEQAAFLNSHADADVVYSDTLVGNENLEPLSVQVRGEPPVDWQTLLAIRNWFPICSALTRRELCQAVGGFDDRLRGAEDWDFWERCAEAGKFAYRPGTVATCRQHSDQTTHAYDRIEGAWRIIVDRIRHDDARLGRLALGALHWRNANRAKLTGHRIGMIVALTRMVLTTYRPRDISLIIRVSSAANTTLEKPR